MPAAHSETAQGTTAAPALLISPVSIQERHSGKTSRSAYRLTRSRPRGSRDRRDLHRWSWAARKVFRAAIAITDTVARTATASPGGRRLLPFPPKTGPAPFL